MLDTSQEKQGFEWQIKNVAVSRMKKFSSNWQKARKKVLKIHKTIANIRKDTLHEISAVICKSYAIVCMEDLQVKNMSHLASVTREIPGRNVWIKSGLSKSILHQGCYEFRGQLEYKLACRGGILLEVEAHNTSRTYLKRQNSSLDNRKTNRDFCCVACGYEENEDVVVAKNILRAWQARLASEVSDAVGRQQEELKEISVLVI